MSLPTNHTVEVDWNGIYILGASAALVPVILGILDISISFLPVGATTDPAKGNVLEWFALLQSNWFLGLRGLGLLNILISLLTVPLYLAFYAALRQTRRVHVTLALIIFCLGASIYIAKNAALPMLSLSYQYANATDEVQKAQLLAAGQATLAQGEDFTLGSLWGFLLNEIAGLIMAATMFRSQIFSRPTAISGMLGFLILLVFTIWATFTPVLNDTALMLAAMGGLLTMVWYILSSRRLFQMARSSK
jgi:hypothetical protein